MTETIETINEDASQGSSFIKWKFCVCVCVYCMLNRVGVASGGLSHNMATICMTINEP